MCEEAKLKQWAKEAINRRQFGVLAGAAAVVACAPGKVTAQGNASVDLVMSYVSFATPDGTMDGVFVHPAEGKHPAVIFWPDIASIREAKEDMVRRLAGEGYAVLMLNPYYRDVAGQQFEDFADFIAKEGFRLVRPWREKHTAQAIGRDAVASVEWLDAQEAVDTARGVGVQGYCMGGPLTVWSAAAVPDRIKAAASFHGGGLVRPDDPLSPHRTLDQSTASYLIAVARDDDAQAPQVKEVFAAAAEEAGRDAIVEVYDGNHGWTVPDSPAYSYGPAEKAWTDLLAFYSAKL